MERCPPRTAKTGQSNGTGSECYRFTSPGGSHVMMVGTYVPTKMGPLLKLQYPFGGIFEVFSIQWGQNT